MIAVECFADEKLVRILGAGKRQIRHEGCKGNIFRKLKKESRGTGLVDEDPESAQPSPANLVNTERSPKVKDWDYIPIKVPPI